MITRILTTTMVAVMLAVAPAVFAQHEGHGDHSKGHGSQAKVDAKSQTVCPVSGKPIDKEVYADHEGKRVYFCCADCKAAFEKDPEKVISKLEAEGIKLEMVSHDQTACPLSGENINKEIFADHDGKRVYFCCPKCKDAFEKDPQKVIQKMEDEGVMLEKVAQKQSMCPVMGGEINTALYSDANGRRVYFCCAMCKPKFDKDPAKYLKEMETKGIELENVKKGA